MKYVRFMAVFFVVLWALLWLVGCKASQNAERQVNRDYTSRLDSLSAQMDDLQANFRLSQQQVTDKLINLKLEHTATYYTMPDSTGKQYPLYISTTKADKDEQTSEHISTEQDATIRRLEEIVDSLSQKVDSALKEERKVVELSWWDLHKWQVGVGVLAVILIIVGCLVHEIKKK